MHAIAAWFNAHPLLGATLVLVLFFVLTGIANWATYPDDAKEWERIKVEEPRRAGVILVLRGWGFYPAKVLRGLWAIVSGQLKLPNAPKTILVVVLSFAVVLIAPACKLFESGPAKEAGANACKAIEVAHQACAYLSYQGPDGKMVTVRVDEQDLNEFGRAMSAKQAKAAASASASSKP